ncbi:MAG: hypothetical protein PHV00_02285 [Syntrophales bacterium]|jgi:hypothetical protein|nr:hypothetical protein [Syntrophales bacterium]HQN26761.1 hypothetical protein [Syntrophales bacterium]
MPKLEPRQIVILGIMVLAILYGAYELLFTGRKGPAAPVTAQQGVDLTTFITDMSAVLGKDAPSRIDAQAIQRAEAEWLRNPFAPPRNDPQWAAARTAPQAATGAAAAGPAKASFNYTGYVDMGHKKIAIVNGNAYAAGDALDVEGYVLKGVTPSRITLINPESGRTLDVPLQE